jgi:hypothetical protein
MGRFRTAGLIQTFLRCPNQTAWGIEVMGCLLNHGFDLQLQYPRRKYLRPKVTARLHSAVGIPLNLLHSRRGSPSLANGIMPPLTCGPARVVNGSGQISRINGQEHEDTSLPLQMSLSDPTPALRLRL